MIYHFTIDGSEVLFDTQRRIIGRPFNGADKFEGDCLRFSQPGYSRRYRAKEEVVKVTFVFDGLAIPPLDGVTCRAVAAIEYLARDPRVNIQVVQGVRDQDCSFWLKQLGIDFFNIEGAKLYRESLSEVISEVRRFGPHIIHTGNSHPVVQHFGRRLADAAECLLVSDVHDIDEHLLGSLKKDEAEVKEFIETQIVAACLTDYVVVMSPVDHAYLLNKSLATNETMALISNGTKPIVNFNLTHFQDEPYRVLFIGNCFYEPNAQAVRYIQHSLAPALCQKFPELKFIIAGRCPPELARDSHPAVCCLGIVQDLEKLALSCNLAIAPLSAGSGLKVKVLTYAGLGIPMIVSPTAAAGFPRGMYHEVAEPGTEFAGAVSRALSNMGDLRRSAKRTLDFVNKHYAWESLINRLVEKYLYWTVDRQVNDSRFFGRRRLIPSLHETVKVEWGETIPLPLWLREKRFSNSES